MLRCTNPSAKVYMYHCEAIILSSRALTVSPFSNLVSRVDSGYLRLITCQARCAQTLQLQSFIAVRYVAQDLLPVWNRICQNTCLFSLFSMAALSGSNGT
ncbi:hypothetical protein B0H67DRAFT_20440 [Lasiosphaeris hirsuta]|uniref:Uncharacterized protein n=1 Tax=Lasiosphaeris hirsuta TaxID=260670 RepID=A0AA40B991_9PEZI|nr:hypothetical protein B0H67DRAFT_20440 [Lasiosphaeris hirsuta]